VLPVTATGTVTVTATPLLSIDARLLGNSTIIMQADICIPSKDDNTQTSNDMISTHSNNASRIEHVALTSTAGLPLRSSSPATALSHTLSSLPLPSLSHAILPSSPIPTAASSGSHGPSPTPSLAVSRSSASLSALSSVAVTSSSERCKRFKIFFCEEMRSLAERIVAMDDRCVLGEISWNQFPDGFPNLFINGAEECKKYHIAFLANFHSPAVFFEQFSLITALPKLYPKSFKLFLPFFPTGTMERVSRIGEVATANSLARILSTIPQSAKGPAQISIFDIHALQTQFYFKDTVMIRLGSCINLLLDRLAALQKDPSERNHHHPINIAFPDDGAWKRFGHMFEGTFKNVIICHKVRDGDKRVVKMKEGDVVGKHCVIVDDLVQSGGTLIECARELLRNGAACVSAYVTHAIFPQDSYRKFLHQQPNNGTQQHMQQQQQQQQQHASPPDSSTPHAPSNPSTSSSCTSSNAGLLRHFWVTDTNPAVTSRLIGQPPFEVLSIAQNIHEIIVDEENSKT